MYKVVRVNIVPEVNEKNNQKHLLVSQKGGQRNLAIPVYKREVAIIASGLSFYEAKRLRDDNRYLEIVKE